MRWCIIFVLFLFSLARSMEQQFLEKVQVGDVASLQLCIDQKVALDFRNEDGRTALTVAAAKGDVEGVSLLLKAGASVDQYGDFGLTPLQWAIFGAHPANPYTDEMEKRMAIVKALLTHGANVRTKADNKCGDTIFHTCFRAVPEGGRKLAFGMALITDLLGAICFCQGPIAKAMSIEELEKITEDESVAFQKQIWQAFLAKNNDGESSVDLACHKACKSLKHMGLCPISKIQESMIGEIYMSVLKNKQQRLIYGTSIIAQ